LLCRALDLLREGKLDGLGDMLAARLMAVETATWQGWPVHAIWRSATQKRKALRRPTSFWWRNATGNR
jgi:hypothetical protein